MKLEKKKRQNINFLLLAFDSNKDVRKKATNFIFCHESCASLPPKISTFQFSKQTYNGSNVETKIDLLRNSL